MLAAALLHIDQAAGDLRRLRGGGGLDDPFS
jgi:hypothetical protein